MQAASPIAGKLAAKAMAVEVKDDRAFQIQKTLEDLKKRLERSKNPTAKAEAKQVLKRGEQLLATLKGSDGKAEGFVDITKELHLDGKMAALYEVIVGTVRQELTADRFERLLAKIHEALRSAKI